MNRLERVNVASLRVALMASAAFAAVYAVVATIIVVLVTNNLQAQIDSRLSADLARVRNGTPIQAPASCANFVSRERLGTPSELAWIVYPDGDQATNSCMGLPAAYVGISGPTTVKLPDGEARIAGTTLGDEHIVLGQSLDAVRQTRDTIAFTELVVGLVLLAVAFVGALVGGRRVGAPIELARQRQMEFTADASHELRTPLSVIEAQTSLALAQDRDPAWYRSAFQRIGHESKRIRGLVEDLLWLARADASPAEDHAEPVEVGVLASQAVDRFAAIAEAKRLRLGLTVGQGPHMVTGSAEWLDRLLGVLVDNACKYAPDGGVVRVTVMNDGHRVRAVVEDSGPGIPESERSRIFERFHRATSDKPGAGLGLAIADAVVRRTHGRWEVGASTALGGASVGVSWPRAGASGREAARSEASLEPAAPAAPPAAPPPHAEPNPPPVRAAASRPRA